MNSVLGDVVLRKLFPTVVGASKLCGESRVDYLIGLSKASWQLEEFLRLKAEVTSGSGRTTSDLA